MSTEPGVYDSFDDFMSEFYPDDPEARARIDRGAELLAAEERGARLAELRQRTHTPVEAVAARMGVALQRVIDLEEGSTGVDLRCIDQLPRMTMGDYNPTLSNLLLYLDDLSSYIHALGGNIDLEIIGGTTSVINPQTGAITHDTGDFHVPAPSEFFTKSLLATLHRFQPAQLKIWAEVEGWRTDIAA
ncbi:hypothetical protein ACFT0G_06160 [Streptomyces sp. NPDC057020]|uniref:hypothetical protein n=1 Tax=unclassified Streptomyces TaxID=2593676 RepID=UPI00362637B4